MTAAQVLVEIVREHMMFRQSTNFVEVLIICRKSFKRTRKEKEKSRAVDVSDNRRTERMPRKCIICVSEDHMIAKFPKPAKDNEKRRNQVHLMKKVIVHATTAKITVTKRYMHLWHLCMAMTNVLVIVFVTVHN